MNLKKIFKIKNFYFKLANIQIKRFCKDKNALEPKIRTLDLNLKHEVNCLVLHPVFPDKYY